MGSCGQMQRGRIHYSDDVTRLSPFDFPSLIQSFLFEEQIPAP